MQQRDLQSFLPKLQLNLTATVYSKSGGTVMLITDRIQSVKRCRKFSMVNLLEKAVIKIKSEELGVFRPECFSKTKNQFLLVSLKKKFFFCLLKEKKHFMICLEIINPIHGRICYLLTNLFQNFC